jgi:hypothetical protein
MESDTLGESLTDMESGQIAASDIALWIQANCMRLESIEFSRSGFTDVLPAADVENNSLFPDVIWQRQDRFKWAPYVRSHRNDRPLFSIVANRNKCVCFLRSTQLNSASSLFSTYNSYTVVIATDTNCLDGLLLFPNQKLSTPFFISA